jgi:GxxExxY protein
MKSVNKTTEAIIGAAIEVHRTLGPGLLGASYEAALCVELEVRGMKYLRQHSIPLTYKGRPIGEYRLDLLVEGSVVIEVK